MSARQPLILQVVAEQLTSRGATLVVGTARRDWGAGDDDAAVVALLAQFAELGGV